MALDTGDACQRGYDSNDRPQGSGNPHYPDQFKWCGTDCCRGKPSTDDCFYQVADNLCPVLVPTCDEATWPDKSRGTVIHGR
jgi:hypothetical protein